MDQCRQRCCKATNQAGHNRLLFGPDCLFKTFVSATSKRTTDKWPRATKAVKMSRILIHHFETLNKNK
jgi:hypothetical protein